MGMGSLNVVAAVALDILLFLYNVPSLPTNLH